MQTRPSKGKQDWGKRWQSLAPVLIKHGLDNLEQEYPHAAIGCEQSDQAWPRPSVRHPVFFGAYDWHSAVHNHWMLLRAVELGVPDELEKTIAGALSARFTEERLAAELAFLEQPGNRGFERPYGLSWLLLLIAELEISKLPEARTWRDRFRPLEKLSVGRLSGYYRALAWPVRAGTHSNTAFCLNLCLDYARQVGNLTFERLIIKRGLFWFEGDRQYNPSFEPSGEDFVSSGLEEVMLMTNILPGGQAAAWINQFLPGDQASSDPAVWMRPIETVNESDGRLVHLAGLNLSRARALQWQVGFLIPTAHKSPLVAAARHHLSTGLSQLEAGGFMGTHWLPTFATLALSQFLQAAD